MFLSDQGRCSWEETIHEITGRLKATIHFLHQLHHSLGNLRVTVCNRLYTLLAYWILIKSICSTMVYIWFYSQKQNGCQTRSLITAWIQHCDLWVNNTGNTQDKTTPWVLQLVALNLPEKRKVSPSSLWHIRKVVVSLLLCFLEQFLRFPLFQERFKVH